VAKSGSMTRFLSLFAGCLAAAGAWAAQPLQPWLDVALPGAVVRLPPGTYAGPAVIAKAITLDGGGQAIIDGGGKGTVLTVRASGVTLRGLTLKNSGHSHDALDGGLMVEGNHNLIENNVVEDVLFGISLHRSNDSVVRGNRIRSLAVDAAERGDGIRLWYSTGNLLEGNDVRRIRDITVTNSPRNRFVGNTVRESRRALNFLFAHRSLVEGNRFEHNSTGIVALNSEGLVIRNNRILHAMDASGAGIALKETSAALVQGNEIVHCAHGIMADSPMNPINRIVFIGNRMTRAIDGAGYGPAVRARTRGPSIAAGLGARALLIRSIGTSNNRFAHTGIVSYDPAKPRIPAASISNPDADLLRRIRRLQLNQRLNLDL